MIRNKRLTHSGIVCVTDERKCTFKTITVTRIDKVTKTSKNIKQPKIRGKGNNYLIN